MKQTSGRSVFQNMAMKCFYFVFCWQRKKKKNFTKKQFNTRLNLFIPSVTRDCRRLTMEQLHVKKEKEKVEWCLGVRWAGSESGCYISMFTGLAQCRTPLPSSTRTGHEEFGGQMIRESKSRKEKSVGRPTSDILLRSCADWPRLHGALGTSFWKCLCFFIQRGREQCNTGSLVQWRWSLKILISTTSLMTGDQLILLTKHCRFNADSNKQNLLEIFWCFQPHLTNIWQTCWPKFIWHTKQTI